MAKKPLVSGSDYDSIGVKDAKSSKGSGGGRTDSDMLKLGLAGGMVVIAALVLAWHFGLFDRGTPPELAPPPPEVLEEIERIQLEEQLQIERGELPPPAAS